MVVSNHFKPQLFITILATAGFLVDATGSYKATFLLSGVSFEISALILATAIFIRRYQRSRSRSYASDLTASKPIEAQHGAGRL